MLFRKSQLSAINRAKAKAEEQAGVIRTLARSTGPLPGETKQRKLMGGNVADVVADV